MPEIETHRSVIAPNDCDILGHMNVARYFDAVSDGGFAMQSAFGLDHRDIRQGRRLSFVVVHSDSRYIAELVAGEVIYLMSCVLEIGGRSALFRHRLYKQDDRSLAFETRFRTVLMDLQARKAVTIPEDVRTRMHEHLVEAE